MDSEKEVVLREESRRALIRALIGVANSKTHEEAVTIAQRQLVKAGQTWYGGNAPMMRVKTPANSKQRKSCAEPRMPSISNGIFVQITERCARPVA